jgi:hypothetical protein
MQVRLYMTCLAVITVLGCVTCKEYEPDVVVRNIPDEDRFVFNTGDHLTYSCSDGSSDTLRVQDVNFYTHSFSEEDWLGIMRNYRIDHARIALEITDTTWLRILHRACYRPGDCSSCVSIETVAFEDEKPSTTVYFGCEEYGGLVIASGVPAVSEMELNGSIYTNVYSWSRINASSEGFSIYWSLRYGILRFEGEIGETLYFWDLEIPGANSFTP